MCGSLNIVSVITVSSSKININRIMLLELKSESTTTTMADAAHTSHFTTDWFTGNVGNLTLLLQEYTQRPDVRMLEIGSWEGRSTTWFLTYLPHATITCVDTFQGGVEHAAMTERHGIEDRFLHNIQPFQDRVTVRKGNSVEQLYGLVPNTYDLIYVDGSHEAPDVLQDVIMSFPLLKVGGIMMMDDYAGSDTIAPDQRLHHPQAAIDAFLDIFKEKIEVIYVDYQVYVRKTAS